MARMRRPKRREPALPPWGRQECGKCAAPVRLVYLEATEPLGFGTSIEVGMKPAPLTDRRATIAATVMNNRLEGRHRIPGTAPQSHETLWIPHEDVCPEVPRPEQLALLPTDQE